MTACSHCGSIATQRHCGNPQCRWVTCLDCRKPSDIPKEHDEGAR